MGSRVFALTALAVLSGWTAASASEPKVLPFQLTRHKAHHRLQDHEPDSIDFEAEQFLKRDTVSSTLDNLVPVPLGFYTANVSVGTPPQQVSLQVDTGSADIWMFGSGACSAQFAPFDGGKPCPGGIYSPSNSNTYQLVSQDGFKIKYGTVGSFVKGDFFKDSFKMGSSTVKSLQMAVASSSRNVIYGIMGIGYDEGETKTEGPKPYPNLIDELKDQGIIGSRTYSLWLNDINEPTGNLLFGGYDSAKYEGELKSLPIIPTRNGDFLYPAVNWTGMSITTPKGKNIPILKKSFPGDIAILDSGTTVTIVPSDVFYELAQAFRVKNSAQLGPIFACENAKSSGTLNYEFGGTGGVTLKAPFSQLAIPILTRSGRPLSSRGIEICRFGLRPEGGTRLPALLFGDTTLSSGYLLYNWDKKTISIAQAKFGATGSDIHEIGGSGQPDSTSKPSTKSPTKSASNPTNSPTHQTSHSPTKSSSSSPTGSAGGSGGSSGGSGGSSGGSGGSSGGNGGSSGGSGAGSTGGNDGSNGGAGGGGSNGNSANPPNGVSLLSSSSLNTILVTVAAMFWIL